MLDCKVHGTRSFFRCCVSDTNIQSSSSSSSSSSSFFFFCVYLIYIFFFLRCFIIGCKLFWAHTEDSDDVDGVMCMDLRFQLKVYTQDTSGERYWPFVVTPLDESLQEIIFAVAVEDIQESWVTNLESALEYVSFLFIYYFKFFSLWLCMTYP
jgi:hypothetical protein